MAGLTLDAGIAYERGEPRVRQILATAFARRLLGSHATILAV